MLFARKGAGDIPFRDRLRRKTHTPYAFNDWNTLHMPVSQVVDQEKEEFTRCG